jgi:hypothetical protein
VHEISAAKEVTFVCGTKKISLDRLYASSVFWSNFLSAKARTLLDNVDKEIEDRDLTRKELEDKKIKYNEPKKRIGDALAQDDGFPALAAILKIRAKLRDEAEGGDNVTALSRLLVLLNAIWDPDRRL